MQTGVVGFRSFEQRFADSVVHMDADKKVGISLVGYVAALLQWEELVLFPGQYETNARFAALQLKMTGKGNFENGIQIIIELAAMIIPGMIVGIGYLTVGLTATYIFMCVLGLAFIITYPIWIRNIYNRMMKRRYENIEGFLSSRP